MSNQVIAGFEILEQIGEGGAGSVYMARQVSLDRLVAIKILTDQLANNPADVEQFKAEAKAAAQLKHTGIVSVYDFGEEEGVYFFAMEYVKGYSVGDWIDRKGTISEEDSLKVAYSVAEALGYANERTGLIHRDIKPDNILIDEDGTVKVVDLGLVKTIHTQQGGEEMENMCTPNYCSPQQANAEANLDCRTDIYSLGCMIWHMLTGTLPFGDAGYTPHQVLDLQVEAQLADPRAITASVSAATVRMIQRMLAKDPAHRQQTWPEVMHDITCAMERRSPAVIIPPEVLSTVAYNPQFDAPKAATQAPQAQRQQTGRVVTVNKEVLHQQHTHSHTAPKKSGAPLAILSILIALGVIGAAISGLQLFQKKQTQKAEQQQEVAAGALYQSALDYARTHADDLPGVIDHFKDVVDQTANTSYEGKAQTELDRMIQRHEDAIAAVIESLKDEAATELLDDDYISAMNIYRHYAGPLAVESRDRREALAAALEPKALEQANRQRQELINNPTPEPPKPSVVTTEPPREEWPAEYITLRDRFASTITQADAAYLTELNRIAKGYTSDLHEVKNQGQRNGILDIVVAVDDELTRIQAEGTLPARPRQDVPATVRVIMAMAAQQRAKLNAARNQSLSSVKETYSQHLKELIRELTVSSRIDEAVKMKSVLQKFEQQGIPTPTLTGNGEREDDAE
ncbi:MAG: serine/threonine protein kinase [Candidatus Omnitrophota bacterium]|jgi:serine/threonine protein kinase